MTDNKEMTIEDALGLVLGLTNRTVEKWDGVDESGLSQSIRDLKQAAAVLRQIGEPVDRSEVVKHCVFCSRELHTSVGMCHYCGWSNENTKYVTKRWTETPVLKRVIETSEPVYSPVESEE